MALRSPAKQPLSVSPAVPAPLNDLPTAIALLAEVSEEPTTVVLERLKQEHQMLGTNVRQDLQHWGVEAFVWSDQLLQFYGETKAFLYETFTWNRYSLKQQMRQWIVDFFKKDQPRPLKILAYGDGLGFDSCGLALAGHQVTYFEVGQRSIAFAKRVFELNRVPVAICSNPEELPTEGFDAIVCLDVLEHVPNPPGMVKDLVRLLRKGGRMIAHAPFWYLHPAVGTHLQSNLQYSGDWRAIYGAAGLSPIRANLAWSPIVFEKPAGATAPAISWSHRLALWHGSWLLRFARWWNYPLIALVRTLKSRDRAKLLAATAFPSVEAVEQHQQQFTTQTA